MANNYGFCIFEDLSGNAVESEQGYSSIVSAREAAIDTAAWWTDNQPRGCYSWEVYDVMLDKTIEVGQ